MGSTKRHNAKSTMHMQYDSFLVRLWREPTSEEHDWIAQIEHIPNEEVKYFSCLDDLFDYLRARYRPDDTTIDHESLTTKVQAYS